MRARLAAAAAAAVLLTGCAGTAVDELPPSALESMEALAAFAREQNDGELAPVVSTPHQHKIEHFVVLLKENRAFDHIIGCMDLPGADSAATMSKNRSLPIDPCARPGRAAPNRLAVPDGLCVARALSLALSRA